MNYLRLVALLISVFPTLDIEISKLFFDGSTFPAQAVPRMLKAGLTYLLVISFSAVAVIYACNRLLKRSICNLDGRRMAYLLLVTIIGAGLIVNVAFKDHLGRARPRDIAEFGGTKLFTPAFIASHECRTNCSFSSGDAAGAFCFIALAKALTRRRRYLAAAIAFGVVVSFARVSAGAHFLSDTVVSFFVMLIAADVFWYYVVQTPEQREASKLVTTAAISAV
jgi:lipid A 4'-phosphatase